MSKIPVMPIGGTGGGIRWEKLLEIPIKLTMAQNSGQSSFLTHTMPTGRWDIVQMVSAGTMSATAHEDRTIVYLTADLGRNHYLTTASPENGKTMTVSAAQHVTLRSGYDDDYWMGSWSCQLSGKTINVYLSGPRSAQATATGTVTIYGGTFQF